MSRHCAIEVVMCCRSPIFPEENRDRLGPSSLRLSTDAQAAALVGYPWLGNVRELKHMIGRSALQAFATH